jgi:hypothetical protein
MILRDLVGSTVLYILRIQTAKQGSLTYISNSNQTLRDRRARKRCQASSFLSLALATMTRDHFFLQRPGPRHFTIGNCKANTFEGLAFLNVASVTRGCRVAAAPITTKDDSASENSHHLAFWNRLHGTNDND